MNDNRQRSAMQERFAEVFKLLRDQDIEQFYANYQLWVMRQRVPTLEQEIATLQTHLAENQQQIQALRPSAIALAVLARLQSNGVRDIALLDQMLERGEDWLDRMMQRLDYCEQVEDFIQGDYTQWCFNSLEGAYDWIDSLRGSTKEEEEAPQATDAANEAEAQATAELLLHRLRIDDEESILDATLKQPALRPPPTPEVEATEIADELNMATPEVEESSLASESDVEQAISAPAPARASSPKQAAPWYTLPIEENGQFDIEHPGSMDDWIKILQADSSINLDVAEAEMSTAIEAEAPASIDSGELVHEIEPAENTTVESVALEPGGSNETDAEELATSEIAGHIEYEPVQSQANRASELADASTRDEEAAGELSQPHVSVEENVTTEPVSTFVTEEAVSIEPEPGEIAFDQEAADSVSEQPEITPGTTSPQEEAESGSLESSEILEVAEVMEEREPEAETAQVEEQADGVASEPGEATITPTDDERAVSERNEVPPTPASEAEMAILPVEVPETPAHEEETPASEIAQEATIEEALAILVETQEQPAAAVTNATPGEEQGRSPGEEEPEEEAASIEELRQIEPHDEEPAPVSHQESEDSTEKGEEAAFANINLEPEEGQRPWYEYLALEEPIDDASQGETAELAALAGQDQLDDETQPMALKKLQSDQGQHRAAKTNEADTASGNQLEASSQENSATELEFRVEEQVELKDSALPPQVAVPPAPTPDQAKPEKVGFWRWLFRRKRKG